MNAQDIDRIIEKVASGEQITSEEAAMLRAWGKAAKKLIDTAWGEENSILAEMLDGLEVGE